jgi:alanine dehydrogenase
MLTEIGEHGGIKNYLWEKEGVRHGVYIYKGNLTNKTVAEKFHMPYKAIDLLIAAHL